MLVFVQALQTEIEMKESEVEKFSDMAECLMEMSNDARLGTYASQVRTRYDDLVVAVRVSTAEGRFYIKTIFSGIGIFPLQRLDDC